MKSLTIKRLDVMSFANFAAVLSAAVAAANVVVNWAVAMFNFAQINVYFPEAVDWNTGFGLLAILVVPAIAAALGWLGGAIIAWFYNVALGGTSGIKFDVSE